MADFVGWTLVVLGWISFLVMLPAVVLLWIEIVGRKESKR